MRRDGRTSLVSCLLVYSVGLALATLHAAGVVRSSGDPPESMGLASDGDGPRRVYELRQRARETRTCDVAQATRLVHDATRHVAQREVRFSENWLQYVLGYAYPPLRQTQDVDLLIQGGVGNCSDRCQILKSVAEAAGMKCRFVGLNGHVVLEVLTDGGWTTCDPDYNVVYPLPTDELARPSRELLLRAPLTTGYPRDVIDRYVAIFQSQHDNVRLPIGSPLSPRLYVAELVLSWLCWVVPAACMALGSWRLVMRAA
jgi:hypothetical protein